MSNIDLEYILTVKFSDIFIEPNTPRDVAEKIIREMAKQRIIGWSNGTILDPEGKVFSDSIKVIPK